jgi:hypothetical protein
VALGWTKGAKPPCPRGPNNACPRETTSLRGAKRRSNPGVVRAALDCFVAAARRLAMTTYARRPTSPARGMQGARCAHGRSLLTSRQQNGGDAQWPGQLRPSSKSVSASKSTAICRRNSERLATVFPCERPDWGKHHQRTRGHVPSCSAFACAGRGLRRDLGACRRGSAAGRRSPAVAQRWRRRLALQPGTDGKGTSRGKMDRRATGRQLQGSR